MIVLLGKSGSGKSTIEKELIDKGYKKIVSYTSRPIRKNEVNGIDYHFISKDKFEKLLSQDYFATNIYFDNNYYGAAKEDCTDQTVIVIGKDALSQIRGINEIKCICFYINVSPLTRFRRMLKRGDSIRRALDRLTYDYKAFKDVEKEVDYVVNNNDGSNGYKHILDILSKNK